jgi:hypothetical protein
VNEKFERDYPRYVGDEMPEKERREFERQVVSDPEFAEEMYADLNVASKLERGEVVKLAPRWWRWATPLAAAALILVAVNVWGPEINETGPVMRGSASVVELVAPVGLVDALPARFEWQTVEGATRYRFELLDEIARVLVRQVMAETFFVVESGVPERGAWRVVALSDLGEELAASPPTGYQVAN